MTTHGLPQDGATVTALLVSHQGARWLPAVLEGLGSQTRGPDRVVAVDTGSTDAGPQLVRDALGDRLGPGGVLEVGPRSGYGEAVRAGLESLPAAGPDEWVWLLHDDSNPAPDALRVLLDAAATAPGVDLLGPKLREWPSLRRLLEVGVTISGTGRRETGLERGEYDQGQHDRTREVLAVNTAGLLIRRAVLERLGLDRRLPLFGNDLDLGWRAARAGHRTMVVPDAVVFHAEAAHRGVRESAFLKHGHRRGERAAALYTLLVNCSLVALPFLAVRLLLGSLLRALGLLLVRAPGEAVDELVGLGRAYAHPLRILSGRRARRRTATVRQRDVRHLLAAPWVPYRHGLDFVSDLAGAVVLSAADLSAARRARNVTAAETGPVAEEAQSLPEDTGLVARLVTSRVAWVFAALVVGSLVAARGLLGGGLLEGGALLPAPAGALAWWRLHYESWHDVGVGSAAPAAPYVLPMAVVGTVLLGKAWLVVDLLFVLSVPLAAAGAYRFLLRVTSSRPMSLWGSVTYGLLPVVTGAVAEGRLGTVAGAVVLPWVASSATGLAARDADRRARAAWRTALWLALLTAFVPLALPLALPLVAAGLVVAARTGRLSAGLVGALLVPPVATVLLLLPWSVSVWSSRGPAAWLLEAGLPAPDLTRPLGRLDVLLGRPGDLGAPGWLTVGLLVAALAALLRHDTRRAVLAAWGVLLVALAGTVALSTARVSPAGGPEQPLWLGFPLLVALAAAVTAAALAGTGIRRRLSASSFGWRQPLGVLVVVVAALTPVLAAGWWLWQGTGADGPLERGPRGSVPTYLTDAAVADPTHGILVVRGSRSAGFDYVVLRQDGLRLGEDSVEPSVTEQAGLTAAVENLVTAPEPEDLTALSRRGIAAVYAPAPADIALVGNLDSLSGVTPGSAVEPGSRAWQLDATPTASALPHDPDPARPWLLGLQGLALLVAVVLAAPTRRTRR